MVSKIILTKIREMENILVIGPYIALQAELIPTSGFDTLTPACRTGRLASKYKR